MLLSVLSGRSGEFVTADCCLHREALPVNGITIGLLEAACASCRGTTSSDLPSGPANPDREQKTVRVITVAIPASAVDKQVRCAAGLDV
jgi:hypothetical protein